LLILRPLLLNLRHNGPKLINNHAKPLPNCGQPREERRRKIVRASRLCRELTYPPVMVESMI
jgi:hypothetical protein